MIDFEKFFLGEVGIIVKSIEEAVEILDACEEEDISSDCEAEDYKEYPYWYVAHGVLNIARTYSEVIENVRHVFTYQTYVFDNQN